MKFALPFLSSFFIAAGIAAQPTLSLGGMPGLGTIISSNAVDATGINPGAAGANQTWDFTAFPDTGAIDTITFISPANTPFSSNFPTSTIAYKVFTDSLNVYGYLKESAVAFELLGSALNDNISDIISIYTNPQTLYSFPSTYNTTYTDTYRSTVDYTSFGATFVSTGTLSYVVDGYGTLITNSGTYPNTLRFKKRDISTDSTISDFGDFVSESRNTTYEWVSVANGASIGIWTISTDTTLGSFGEPDSYSLNVSHARGNFGSTGLEPSLAHHLMIYPNPASDQILLMLPTDAQVNLLDMGGRIYRSHHFSLAGGGLPTLNIADLPSGAYVVQAIAKGHSSFCKLLIIH